MKEQRPDLEGQFRCQCGQGFAVGHRNQPGREEAVIIDMETGGHTDGCPECHQLLVTVRSYYLSKAGEGNG